jgi:N-acylneuraminate cytidylyltransferase
VIARGGSKRIPGKNIRPLHGKPLVSWTLEALKNSAIFSRIVVSTDSLEIAAIAESSGAEVPFLRPTHLANDFASTAQVADHAISWLLKTGVAPATLFCVVYPAAVAITSQDLVDSLKTIKSGEFDIVFAGCEFPSHPQRAWLIDENNRATPSQAEYQSSRSQDLIPMYYDAGQFYWCHESSWRDLTEGREVRRGLHVLSRTRAIDIDTDEDWSLLEIVFRAR